MGETKKISLQQVPAEDHAAKVMREKIGNVRDIKPVEGAFAPHAQRSNDPTPNRSPQLSAIESQVVEKLRTVFDPELPVNIYDLGLIYDIEIASDLSVHVRMTLTAPGCPVAGTLPGEVERKIEEIEEVSHAKVELVWEPQWGREMMSEAALLDLGLL